MDQLIASYFLDGIVPLYCYGIIYLYTNTLIKITCNPIYFLWMMSMAPLMTVGMAGLVLRCQYKIFSEQKNGFIVHMFNWMGTTSFVLAYYFREILPSCVLNSNDFSKFSHFDFPDILIWLPGFIFYIIAFVALVIILYLAYRENIVSPKSKDDILLRKIIQ